MKPQTLISMVDYVLLQNDNWKREIDVMTHFNNCVNYAQSLQELPTIADFIPAVYENGKWRVLEEPIDYVYWKEHDVRFNGFFDECKIYQTALNNVKFSGWETKGKENPFLISDGFREIEFWYYSNRNIQIFLTDFSQEKPIRKQIKNLNDLVKRPLTERGMEYFNINV